MRRQTAVTAAVVTTVVTSALTVTVAPVTAGAAPTISSRAGGPAAVAEPPGTRAAGPRAFPGAEGWGTDTPGGRGGRVINVTTLADAGPGSFRRAATASGRRIIVFRVSGTIVLESDIDIVNPYVTIAGQTAPGGGITLRSDPCNSDGVLGVLTHDVVIRYLRLRPGPHPCAGPGESSDGIVIYKPGTHHVVIDHCSISWGVDENISLYDDAHDVTFSWNIVSEGLANSTHEEGEHSKGAHLSGERTFQISFHHNLLAHNNDRNPQPTNPGVADIRNNVIYNYGENAALTSNSHGKTHFNFVGNYYKRGPDSDPEEYELDVYGPTSVGWAFFVAGNIGPHRTQGSQPERRTVDPAGRPYMVPDPFPFPSTRTTSAAQAYGEVLRAAGARVQYRDAVDRRIVRDVRHATGHIIDDPAEVGGWPVLPATAAPLDSDRDGMPNAWEQERGLKPQRDDSRRDRNGDGYTNIEEYLAWLVS